MKIVLLKDVKGLGRAGEIKEVSNGYAQNFLLRQGAATQATEQNIKAISQKINRKKQEKAATRVKNKK